MRIIAISDIHLGDYRGPNTADGRNGRLADIQFQLRRVLEYTSEVNARAIFILGDVFKDRNPTAEHMWIFAKFIADCRDSGLELYIIPGNHDQDRLLRQVSYLRSFEPMLGGDIHLITQPEIISFGERRVFFFPYIRSPQEPALIDFLKKSTPEDVLVMHGIIAGSKAGLFEYEINDDDIISTEVVKHLKLVLAGDIHQHQNFGNVWYPGSLERLTFNDEKDDKGFLDVEMDNGQIEVNFIKLNARRMLTLTATQLPDVEDGKIVVENAIVRILDIDSDTIPRAKKLMQEKGCYHLSSLRMTKQEEQSVNRTSIKITDLIAKYAEKVGYKGDLGLAVKSILDTLAAS